MLPTSINGKTIVALLLQPHEHEIYAWKHPNDVTDQLNWANNLYDYECFLMCPPPFSYQ